MITQKVQIEGVEYEVSSTTYKMLQDSIKQLHLSVKNYNLVKEELAPRPPKPPVAKKTKKRNIDLCL